MVGIAVLSCGRKGASHPVVLAPLARARRDGVCGMQDPSSEVVSRKNGAEASASVKSGFAEAVLKSIAEARVVAMKEIA
ncbi:MAG: hypothetical protein RLZZ528_1820 [Pseudomonadota bacterium]|jgi:hypothetical protein